MQSGNIYNITPFRGWSIVKLSTLLIKKGSHKQYATLTTLAVVWALWSFKIFIWSELYWWALKERNSCCLQIDLIYIYIYICVCIICLYIYIYIYIFKYITNYHSFLCLLLLQRNSNLPSATASFLNVTCVAANLHIIRQIFAWFIY